MKTHAVTRAALGMAALALAVTGCGRAPGAAKAELAAAGNSSVSPAGQRLLELLAHARTMTYQASYTVRGNDPQLSAGSFVIDVYRKPPLVRSDTTNSVPEGAARSAEIRLRDGRQVHCAKLGNDPWSCVYVDPAGPAFSGFDNLIGVVKGQLVGAAVLESEMRVNGRTSQCFGIVKRTEPRIEVCVTDDGVPTRVADGPQMLELTSLRTRVDDGVFTPPATPTG